MGLYECLAGKVEDGEQTGGGEMRKMKPTRSATVEAPYSRNKISKGETVLNCEDETNEEVEAPKLT